MATEVGATLREARQRRGLTLAEVEQQTRIRPRYLEALENEEWDALPAGPYARSFIKTYAAFLGLDGERLADEFRHEHRETPEERPALAEPAPRKDRPRRPRLGRGALAALISLALIAVLVVLALTSGSDQGAPTPAPSAQRRAHRHKGSKQRRRVAAPRGASLKLTARADVWVCLVNARGKTLINGQVLSAGSAQGPFRSGRFEARFGNGQVSVLVNGQQAKVADTGSPVGYEFSRKGTRPLATASQPSCG